MAVSTAQRCFQERCKLGPNSLAKRQEEASASAKALCPERWTACLDGASAGGGVVVLLVVVFLWPPFAHGVGEYVLCIQCTDNSRYIQILAKRMPE